MSPFAEPSTSDVSSSGPEIISEVSAHLTDAYQLLVRIGRTISLARDGLTFVEVDEAVRSISRALLALGEDRPVPAPPPHPLVEPMARTARTTSDRPVRNLQM
jgi:hypothetical protein